MLVSSEQKKIELFTKTTGLASGFFSENLFRIILLFQTLDLTHF